MADRSDTKRLREMVVAVKAAGSRNPDIGIGDIVGSAVAAILELDERLAALEVARPNTQTEQERP